MERRCSRMRMKTRQVSNRKGLPDSGSDRFGRSVAFGNIISVIPVIPTRPADASARSSGRIPVPAFDPLSAGNRSVSMNPHPGRVKVPETRFPDQRNASYLRLIRRLHFRPRSSDRFPSQLLTVGPKKSYLYKGGCTTFTRSQFKRGREFACTLLATITPFAAM